MIIKKRPDIAKSKVKKPVYDNIHNANAIIKQFNDIMHTNITLNIVKHPESFTEKLLWLKIYDNNYLKALCADKLNLRKYCQKILKIDLCPKVLQVYDNPGKISNDNLPGGNFIIKCNHGSGFNIVTSKAQFNDDDKARLYRWYKTDFSSLFFEQMYCNIERKIFIEELLDIDCEYKVFCFNGKPQFAQCIFYDNLGNTIYKPDPNYIKKWSRHDALVDSKFRLIKGWQFNINRPSYRESHYLQKYYKKYKTNQYKNILKYSAALSKNFKFVRCDFYHTANNKVYLSEMTFIPSAGFMHFNSRHTDCQIGKLLNLG